MKAVTVKLYMSEILYDVKSSTYIAGRSRENGENFELVAAMQVGDDDENQNKVLRFIGTAYNEMKNKLSNYVSGTETATDNEQLDGDTNLTLTLNMPSNFNLGMADTITEACHKYIVNKTIAGWFALTNPNEVQVYEAYAQEAIRAIREAANKREAPKRTAPTA